MADVYVEHALRVLGRHAKRAAEEALAPLKIRAAEYDIMETISGYMNDPDIPELTVTAIAGRTSFSKHSVSGYIGNLQRSGYVRETPGRSRLLTTAGIEALEECRFALRHVNRQMAALLDDFGLADITTALLKYRKKEGEL